MKQKKHKLTEEIEEKAHAEEAAANDGTPSEMEEKEPDPMKRIAELELANAELKDKYLRSMAEFENYRRRSIAEKSDWIKLATQKLALELCDVADNFERALAQVDESEREHGFVKGVMQIEQQLRGVLAKEGVCKIEALGKEFDPSLHEALAHIPSDFDANLVAAVIQNGYTMHDKVLRPVRVAVSSGKHEESTEDPEPAPEQNSTGGEDPKTIDIEVK
ncbi:MAG: nucleotide exchange factor GrpE [Candidatus Cloacimonetes bacterium]|nr:nucleotide exchange factor GrpE [Candidatus Cloacimonadota bacterium]